MVSMLAFYSDDPSSIPAEVYNFSVKLLLKRTKKYINKKRPWLAHFFLKKGGQVGEEDKNKNKKEAEDSLKKRPMMASKIGQ